MLVSLLVGLSMSVFCLWLAFKDVDFTALSRSLSQVGWAWVAGSVLLGYLGLAVRSFRWSYLLPISQGVRFSSLLSATFIGMMANNILPARVGEVVRAWVLRHRDGIPVPEALGSIVLERLLDVLAALVILGGCLALSPDLGDQASRLLKRAGSLLLAVALVAVAALVFAGRRRDTVVEWMRPWAIRMAPALAQRAMNGLSRFLRGLDGLRGGRQIATLGVLSLLIWAMAIASFQLIAEGLNLQLSVIQMSLVFIIVLFGVAIPSAPGFVGTFHGFCVAGLTLVVGMDATPAATFATLAHGSGWLAITLAGFAFLFLDGTLTWSRFLAMWKAPTGEGVGDRT